ncbi:MAG: LD-carboxypeptidase [Planctomycetes bacterium]|nr:LD-carboxypeptidase [Planctomycetota bacterium]
MTQPRLHLIAPAAPCRSFFSALGGCSAQEFVADVQEWVGSTYEVTADAALMNADEDELAGGRTDDRQRADDIEQALADDAVVAVVALRGGAWFTRILPLIDFSVLDRRTKPVAAFGFSELTTLVNIVGAHERGLGFYAPTPAFLIYGLKRYAATLPQLGAGAAQSPDEWMQKRLSTEVKGFFLDVVDILKGVDQRKAIEARHVRGDLSDACAATFVGGNLTVLSTLIGSRYASCVNPAGRWLVLEDYNDKPERIDRFLAHLTLAGYWDACEGVLLGDFHQNTRNLTDAVLAMLEFHLPADSPTPILVTDRIGHIWPADTLPLHQPMTLRRSGEASYSIQWPTTSPTVVQKGVD